MGKLIDELGKRYGRLTVIEKVKVNNRTKWKCKCDCGNEILVFGSQLRTGNTQSCGCLQRERARQSNENRVENIIGKKFNLLTVKSFYGYKKNNDGRNERLFLCQCDCGNEKISSYNDIVSGKVKSCGCLIHRTQYIDEIGNRYGKLTVISFEGYNNDKKTLWKCQCDCGGTIITTGKSLRNGLIYSCGCIKSKGEEKLSNILLDNNIIFSKQWTFPDLKSKNNYPLYFDFAIFNEENKLICLIEYQGSQHYDAPHGKWTDKTQETDVLKKDYCNKNNIKLITIPYWDYDKLDWNYLKEVM